VVSGDPLLPSDHGFDFTHKDLAEFYQQSTALIMLYENILEAGVDYSIGACAAKVIEQGTFLPDINTVVRLTALSKTFQDTGYLPIDMRGRYDRKLLLENDELKQKFLKHIAHVAQQRGRPNMSIKSLTECTVQCDEIIDVSQYVYPPNDVHPRMGNGYEFVFNFDWSSCHDKMPEGCMSTSSLKQNFKVDPGETNQYYKDAVGTCIAREFVIDDEQVLLHHTIVARWRCPPLPEYRGTKFNFKNFVLEY
jgi:hypothetical protein